MGERDDIKKWYLRSISILFPFLIVLFVYSLTYFVGGIFFETNDDRCISEIFSGNFAIKPNSHSVYVNVVLGVIFSWLFSITTNISWYGIFLLLLQCFSFSLIGYCFFKTKRDFAGCCEAIVLFGLALLSNYRMFALVQYTSIAAIASFAGYMLIISEVYNNESHKTWQMIVFILLQSVSFCLRDKAMMMMQPVCMIILASVVLRKNGLKKSIRYIGVICASLIAVVTFFYTINRISYSSEEWKKYNEYNEVRTDLFDYYGIPSYADIADIADKYGVSKEAYEAFYEHTVLMDSMPVEMLNEIRTYVIEHPCNPEWKMSTWDCMSLNHIKRLSVMGVLLSIITVGVLLYSKDKRSIMDIIFALLMVTLIIAYLIWKGRYPYRVVAPILSVIYFFCSYNLSERISVKRWMISIPVYLVLIVGCLYVDQEQYYFSLRWIEAGEEYSDDVAALINYCDSHSEGKYLIEGSIDFEDRGNPFETVYLGKHNSIVSGGWYANSPCMNERFHELFAGEEYIYFITRPLNENGINYLVEYMNSITDNNVIFVKELELPSGRNYRLYQMPNAFVE